MRNTIAPALCAMALFACGDSNPIPPRGGGGSGGSAGEAGAGGQGAQGGSAGQIGSGGMMTGGTGGNGTGGLGSGGSAGTAGRGAMFLADSDGYVVMEMESVAIPGGSEWVERNDLSDYTGSGYYRFTGNSICSGPAGSPLRYEFEILEGARYELRLRAAKIAHCVANENSCTSLGEPPCQSGQTTRTDISNDAFVHIEDAQGRYVTFVDQESRAASSVGEPVKLFGGQSNAWAWTGTNALDPSEGKFPAHWDLDPGVYNLVIQGRSQSFRIDRVLLFDADTGSTSGAVDRPETR